MLPPLSAAISGAALATTLMLAAVPGAPARAGVNPAALRVAFIDRPPAPHCGAMAARYGPQRLWFGAISAVRQDPFWDRYMPYYAEGCFTSERSCRTWLHENLSFANGPLKWMRCSPGVPGRALH